MCNNFTLFHFTVETENPLFNISKSMHRWQNDIFLFQNKSVRQIPIHEFVTVSYLNYFLNYFLKFKLETCRLYSNSPNWLFYGEVVL